MKFELLFFSRGGGEILKYAGNCPKILMILEFGGNFKKNRSCLKSPKMLKVNGVGFLTLNLKIMGKRATLLPKFFASYTAQCIDIGAGLNHTQKKLI